MKIIREYGYFLTGLPENDDVDLDVEFVDTIPEPCYLLSPYYGASAEYFYWYIHNAPVCIDFQRNKILASRRVRIDNLIPDVIEPFILLGLQSKECTFIHSSAFVANNDGEGVIFSAWPHTGKTNMILSMMTDLPDASFLGDEYTVLSSQGLVYSYPRTVKLFDYNIREHPEIKKKLKGGLKSMLSLRTSAGVAGLCIRLQKRFVGDRFISLAILSALNLAIDGINPKLDATPEDLGWTIGANAKANKLFVMMTERSRSSPAISTIEDKISVSTKLTANILWEKELLHRHYLGYLFPFPTRRIEGVDNILERQRGIVLKGLENTECFEVKIGKDNQFKDVINLIRSYL